MNAVFQFFFLCFFFFVIFVQDGTDNEIGDGPADRFFPVTEDEQNDKIDQRYNEKSKG